MSDKAEKGGIRDRLEAMAAAANEAELRWLLGEWITELADEGEDECSAQRGLCFCGSAEWLRERAALLRQGEGCDCAELCSMGPTCPGGMLAGLPDSGCWRSSENPSSPGATK